jgi:hypothetical protein
MNSKTSAFKEYEIRIAGELADHWSDWFEGLSIQPATDSETILRGQLQDQSALLGVLNKIHGLNLKIVSVVCTGEK